MRIKPHILTWLVLLAFLTSSFAPVPAQSTPWQEKVDPWVIETAAQGETEFLVYLTQQADVSAAASLPTKLEKGRYVQEMLYNLAQRTQGPLLAELSRLGVAHRSYYIANMVWVRGGQEVIQSLAQRPDVAHLYANPAVKLATVPVETSPQTPEATEAIEWNILKVNADDVWAAGYTGQGAVIGGQDTGYDWDHPALINQYRGWNGSSADHDYNWHDAIHVTGSICGADSPVPCDDDDHGTHTMGTMVGDDGGTNQIGMAPGARWIGCRNMNSGVGTPATYAECYEWFIAPYPVGGTPAQGDPSMAPDVINNSWGCPPSEGCTDPNVLLAVVNNVRAAGILTVHSAGNSRPSCSTVDDPAAIYDASFSVGATDSSDNIASFSSRGPVTIDGSNRLKPEISAPGVGIRSSVPGGGYASGWSGTSMAAPHVAGMAALLISVDPSLAGQPDALEALTTGSAVPRTTTQTCGGVPGSSVPNNTYGWGRIDVLGALLEMSHTFELSKTASALQIAPGQEITYTLAITHVHPTLATTNVILTDTLPAGTSLVSAAPAYTLNGDTLVWNFATLGANETRSAELVVSVPLTYTGDVTNANYAVRSDHVGTTFGAPVITSVIPYGMSLQKTAAPAVVPGGLITYTLELLNLHPTAALHNVILTDTLPANTTFVTATLPHTMNGSTLTWQFPSLEVERPRNVNLVVLAPTAAGQIVTNEDYSANSDEFGPVQGTPVQTEVLAQSLEIGKIGPAVVAVGAPITYTLAVTNPHPAAAAHHLVLTDTLPANTVFVSAQPPATPLDGMVTWTLPTLAPEAIWQVELVVRAPITFTGTIVNRHYGADSDETPPVAGEAVITQIHSLGLSKSTPASLVQPGDLITYTLQVSNLHPSAAATNLVLTDTLPAGAAFVSSDTAYTMDGNTITWTRASLPSGDAWTVSLTVRVLYGAIDSVTNAAYGVRSAEAPDIISGPPVSTPVEYRIYLPVVIKG